MKKGNRREMNTSRNISLPTLPPSFTFISLRKLRGDCVERGELDSLPFSQFFTCKRNSLFLQLNYTWFLLGANSSDFSSKPTKSCSTKAKLTLESRAGHRLEFQTPRHDHTEPPWPSGSAFKQPSKWLLTSMCWVLRGSTLDSSCHHT